MTDRRYQHGCAGESQARGETAPWYRGGRVVVGFYHGVVNYDFDSSRAFARAVRVSGQ